MLNNKGQIGETMTWTVATIVVVVILIVFVIIASVSGGDAKEVKTIDEARDLITTKSFVNFLNSDGNFERIKEKKYEELEGKFKSFSTGLSTENKEMHFDFKVKNKDKFSVGGDYAILNLNVFYSMDFMAGEDNIKLIINEFCKGKCQ